MGSSDTESDFLLGNHDHDMYLKDSDPTRVLKSSVVPDLRGPRRVQGEQERGRRTLNKWHRDLKRVRRGNKRAVCPDVAAKVHFEAALTKVVPSVVAWVSVGEH